MLKHQNHKRFIHDFTAQWLDTNQLDSLTPTPAVFINFNDQHRSTMKAEVELTFAEILDKNRPLTDFIDPDFLYTDATIGRRIYQLARYTAKPAEGKKKAQSAQAKPSNRIERIDIPRGGRHGGVLSMAAVMAATANGTETQPVRRGVWVLENVLGTPPPDPPNTVPPLTPDTTGTKGPRERLAAHMADASCASCHRDIDPLGFMLESHDPIGRWRTHYPGPGGKRKGGPAVDSSGTLPNGTELKDVTDLKQYLVEHPELFSNCLARHLVTYAVGRRLNFRERWEIEQLVKANIATGNHFHNLMLDLVDSPVFRAR